MVSVQPALSLGTRWLLPGLVPVFRPQHLLLQRQSNVSILNVRRPWKRCPVPFAGQQAFRKVNSFLKIHYFMTQPFHFLQKLIVTILEGPDRLVCTTKPSTTNTVRYGPPDGGDGQEKNRPAPKYEEYR